MTLPSLPKQAHMLRHIAGKTYLQIGHLMGVTKQRAWQLVREAESQFGDGRPKWHMKALWDGGLCGVMDVDTVTDDWGRVTCKSCQRKRRG